MNMPRMLCLGMAMLLLFTLASARVNDAVVSPVEVEDVTRYAMDEQCTIDYIGFLLPGSGGGGGHGNIRWLGGTLVTNFGSMMFLNSCTNDTMYAFCIDLDHNLNQGPYCANIDPAVVSALYPEQYTSMAYVQTWFEYSGDAQARTRQDDILQLAIWKLSANQGGGPSNNVPFYRINAGRGWPDTTSLPLYPFVNTVLSTNPDRNNPANDLVRNALGATDGIQKNVIMCGDDILWDIGSPSFNNGTATVPITLTVQRGADALAAGNLGRSGIKVQLSTDVGALSAAELFTDANGQALFTISQPFGTPLTSNLEICSRGAWPRLITPCSGQHNLQYLAQKLETSDMCEVCLDLPIPPSSFLAVELKSIDAIPGDGIVAIIWETASEEDNASFRIERDGFPVHSESATNQAAGAYYRWNDHGVINGRTYTYHLIAVDMLGEEQDLGTVSATPSANAGPAEEFALEQNIPNPFNPATTISFNLPEAGYAKLTVFDVVGREVEVLVDGHLASGIHRATFSGGDLPSGVYFYKFETPTFSATKKMTLMR